MNSTEIRHSLRVSNVHAPHMNMPQKRHQQLEPALAVKLLIWLSDPIARHTCSFSSSRSRQEPTRRSCHISFKLMVKSISSHTHQFQCTTQPFTLSAAPTSANELPLTSYGMIASHPNATRLVADPRTKQVSVRPAYGLTLNLFC